MALDVIIVNIAYLLTFTTLAVREIYWLRIILTLLQLGQFIAEISYITNNPVLADVIAHDELLFIHGIEIL